MAFPSSNLSLSTVCNAFNLPKSLLDLQNSVYYTSGTTGGVSTAVVVTRPVYLSRFFNTFISSIGTLDDQSPGNQDVIYFGYGNQSITNISYTMTHGVLTQLVLNWNLSSGNRNGGLGTTTNSDNLQIISNGDTIVNIGVANRNPYVFPLSISSTLSIHISANVNNSAGGEQNSMSNTWNYNVTASGLSIF